MSWSNFGKLNSLNIHFAESPSSFAAEIYGNSENNVIRNQVEVIIEVDLSDIDYNPLDVSASDITNALSLCDYETGSPLLSPWIASSERGDYVRAIGYSTVVKSHHHSKKNVKTFISLFISCSEYPNTRSIAVNIDIPGVGPFNTSKNGTPTLNGPNGETGGVFKSPSQVTVTSVATVDYSRPENISVINRVDGKNSYTTDDSSINIEREGGMSVDDGKAAHQTTPTHIKTASTLQNHYFLGEKTVVNRKKASLSNLGLVEMVDQSFSIPFSGTAEPDQWTYVFGIWVNRETIGSTSGGIQMMQSRTIDKAVIYHTESKNLSYTATLPTDAVAVRTTKYDITIDELYRDNWDLSEQSTSVSVTDNFGNTGSLTIQLVNNGSDDNSGYHPYLRVNGE
ncbi:hypothetical protein [Enterobacter kobei]|uniref:hypothetical protein n=1 Tax=Enterobacter kobei TaxID=208224 RepID=UPI0021C1CBC1|nr:hypothetical protein [Enterobacter kobei]UXJ66651.1 hypothetical protein N5P26_21885 [Enterobacter kobei]HDC4501908.1 hypothetical protein [Enterobacter kobei]